MPKAKGGQPRVEDLFRDPDAGAKNAYLTRYLIGAVEERRCADYGALDQFVMARAESPGANSFDVVRHRLQVLFGNDETTPRFLGRESHLRKDGAAARATAARAGRFYATTWAERSDQTSDSPCAGSESVPRSTTGASSTSSLSPSLPSISAIRCRAARAPISSDGTRTVVSGG